MERKEEIILATLNLASKKGLAGVSMDMIAKEVGIKKPSLYNHFNSKSELIKEMYVYLKKRAQQKTETQIDANILENSASDVLKTMVNNYVRLINEEFINLFYQVIYCERAISSDAAQILATETYKMVQATKYVLSVLMEKKKLSIKDVDACAVSFALTIHGLIDFEFDSRLGQAQGSLCSINQYIDSFCEEHKLEGKL